MVIPMAVIAALLWLHADKIYPWHTHTNRENSLLFKITGFNEKHIDNPEQDIGNFRVCGFGPYPGRCLFLGLFFLQVPENGLILALPVQTGFSNHLVTLPASKIASLLERVKRHPAAPAGTDPAVHGR